MELVSQYFGADRKGIPNFKPEIREGLKYFVGNVKSGTKRNPINVPCFYIDGDLNRESYQAICNQRIALGFSGKIHIFVKGFEVLQSPNVLFHRVSKDGSRILSDNE